MTPTATVPFTCPACGRALGKNVAAFSCDACGQTYALAGGIPQLVADADAVKEAQAAWFNGAPSEWETVRPHGAPALYGWLLREKLRRAVTGLDLRGMSVLTVCSGSGMDAEFLARAGARVVAADISPGAAQRTAERARRFGVEITPIVADAEHLPFAGRSFDIVFVHDGLHHLERPLLGLAEMARVARHAVSLTEPARAQLTSAAVRLGLAEEREEAGNPVGRLELRDVERALVERGFQPLRAERYAMLYRHEPGALMRLLSLAPVYPLAVAAFRIANLVLGRIGNKLVVVGVRT